MFTEPKIAIVGSGSWATALAKILLNNVDRIGWYFRNPESIEQFKRFKHNPGYLRGVEFDIERIDFYCDINKAFEDHDVLVLTIPSAFLDRSLTDLNVELTNKYIVSAIKGIIPEGNQIVGQYLNQKFKLPYERIGLLPVLVMPRKLRWSDSRT